MQSPLTLEVTEVRAEARDVMLLELRDPGRGTLPAFEPGAHLELRLPNGMIRHYSLLNDWREADRYVVAVGRAADGRGGSACVHGALRCGARVLSTAPRNDFRLDPAASAYRFVAGGIGITPILAMVRWCEANGRPWRLVYAARSRQRAAFYEELRAMAPSRVRFHFDDEEAGLLDVAAALSDLAPGEQVYCCGPQPLMRAVEAATADLPAGTARFEWFAAPRDGRPPAGAVAAGAAAAGAAPDGAASDGAADADGEHEPDGPFRVELRRSGRVIEVPADRSLLEALEDGGIEVPWSCREGMCRTCETAVCAGVPDHRDYVLSADERAANGSMLPCVSRARTPSLVLDL